MAVQLSVALRNARLDAIETAVGPLPVLKMWTGSQPASCAASDSGFLVATFSLSPDWASPASGGSKTLIGVDSLVSAALAQRTATIGHYRFYSSSGTVHMQGTVGAAGSGADLTVDEVNVTQGQTINITSWSLTDGNS